MYVVPEQMEADERKGGSGAVDEDIADGGAAAGNEGLVILISGGEEDAEGECGKEQGASFQIVNMAGKGYGEGEQEVFGHVRQFADGEFYFLCIDIKFCFRQVSTKEPIADLDDFIADLRT